MKLAVVSDTHGNWPFVAQAVRQDGTVDYLIFLGDHASDGKQLAKASASARFYCAR